MNKIIFNWKYLLFFSAILLLILYMVYSAHIFQYYKFNTNPTGDLNSFSQSEILGIRNGLLKNNLRFTQNYFEMNALRVKIVSALAIVSIFIFYTLKSNSLKYLIGKTENYNIEKRKAKIKTSFIPVIFCWIVIGIIGGISLFSGNNLNENFEFIQKISTDPFISSIALNPIIGFLIMEVLISLGIYTLTYLGITLVDKYGKYEGIVYFETILWILPIIVANIDQLSVFKLPDVVINFYAVGNWDLKLYLIPLSMLILAILWIPHLENKNEEII